MFSGNSISGFATCCTPGPRAVLWRALPTRISHRRELVTVAVEGEDPDGPVGVGFELPPEPEDVGVNGASGGESLVSPHLVQQSLARDHFAPMGDQKDEQIELLPRQADFPARLEHLPNTRSNPDVAECELLEPLPRSRPAQHRPYSREKLAQREGLGHVVVRPQLEPANPVDFLPPRGEHDDGDVAAPLPQRAADVPL